MFGTYRMKFYTEREEDDYEEKAWELRGVTSEQERAFAKDIETNRYSNERVSLGGGFSFKKSQLLEYTADLE
jgi:hypothetical protein